MNSEFSVSPNMISFNYLTTYISQVASPAEMKWNITLAHKEDTQNK